MASNSKAKRQFC